MIRVFHSLQTYHLAQASREPLDPVQANAYCNGRGQQRASPQGHPGTLTDTHGRPCPTSLHPADWCVHVPGYTFWRGKETLGYDIGNALANMSAWQLGALCNATAGCLGGWHAGEASAVLQGWGS